MSIGNIPTYDYAGLGDAACYYGQYSRDLMVQEWRDPDLPKIKTNSGQDQKSWKVFTSLQVLNFNELVDRKISLIQSMKESYENSSISSKVSFDRVVSDFSFVLDSILLLSPDAIDVGVSDDESLFIYTKHGDKSVFLDLFFDENEPTDVLLNVTEGRNTLCSYTSNVNNSLIKLKSVFPVSNDSEYELSSSYTLLSNVTSGIFR